MHEVGTLNGNNLFEMHGVNNIKISKDCSSELLVGRNASGFLLLNCW
jgi:hypothetical protein